MATINLYEAKTHLSKLIDRAARGEDIVIARGGRPVARLTRLEEPAPRIRFGTLRGEIRYTDDFDAPLPEDLLADFEND